jgi:DNA-binding response OmpR family regulator
MTPAPFVLLVEDHDGLRAQGQELLTAAGFEVHTVECAEALDDTPLPRTPDLYVIDLGLPGEDGLSLARRVRKARPEAGIVITTGRGQLAERVLGYQSGADVYLTKPVNPEELVAVLQGIWARGEQRQSPPTPPLVLQPSQLKLRGPQGSIRLSASEVRLLVALSAALRNTLERWQVAAQLGVEGEDLSIESMQVRISLLRKKLRACAGEVDTIKAVRAEGYRLCVPLVVD